MKTEPIEYTYREVFDKTFKGRPFNPQYTFRYSYGYPSFQVAFKSNKELDHAKREGVTEQFTAEIEKLRENYGSRKYPFDPKKAIWFTSIEELDEIKKKYGQDNY